MKDLCSFNKSNFRMYVQYVEYKENTQASDIYGIFNENIRSCDLKFSHIEFIEYMQPKSNLSGNWNKYDIVFNVVEQKYGADVLTPSIVKIRIAYDDWYISGDIVKCVFKDMLDNIRNYVNIMLQPGEKDKTITEFKKIWDIRHRCPFYFSDK